MAVFATAFGRLAERLSKGNISETLQSHVGVLPNPLSKHSKELKPRIEDAKVFRSVCPYCAVGCGQRVYVKDDKVIDIEGDPDSPISSGTLCPKGSASFGLINNPNRVTKVKYRAPYASDWEEKPLEWAMQRIAERVYATREATFEEVDEENRPISRTLGIGSLGGATLDNEENYLITKLFHSWGMVSIENQARI